jgi:hypothetical protein
MENDWLMVPPDPPVSPPMLQLLEQLMATLAQD